METITGTVISGEKRGRGLGFPTANIKVDSELALGAGIYAGYVIVGAEKYQSAMYLPGTDVIEAFIIDFSEDLYDKEVQVQIVEKIRDKQDFKSDQEAKDQIAGDVIKTKEILNKL